MRLEELPLEAQAQVRAELDGVWHMKAVAEASNQILSARVAELEEALETSSEVAHIGLCREAELEHRANELEICWREAERSLLKGMEASLALSARIAEQNLAYASLLTDLDQVTHDRELFKDRLASSEECRNNLFARIKELEEQNRHDDAADTECRNLLMSENDDLRAERDRYRVALEAVRSGLCYPDEYFQVADDALHPKTRKNKK